MKTITYAGTDLLGVSVTETRTYDRECDAPLTLTIGSTTLRRITPSTQTTHRLFGQRGEVRRLFAAGVIPPRQLGEMKRFIAFTTARAAAQRAGLVA